MDSFRYMDSWSKAGDYPSIKPKIKEIAKTLRNSRRENVIFGTITKIYNPDTGEIFYQKP